MNREDIPLDLIERLQKKDVALFIGSGVSMNAGLVSWTGLIRPLAEALDLRWPDQDADINTDHLLTACRYYENRFGRNSLIHHLQNKLDTVGISPSLAHLLISVLPAQVIFTTNYDDLIERSFRESGKPIHVIVNETELAYWGEDKVQIIKLCGELNRPESIAITKYDFNIFPETHRRLIERLRSTLETKTALFLGYGLRDPFVNQIWDNISYSFKEHRRYGYMVLFDGDPLEMEDLKTRGVHAISLDSKGKDKSEVFHSWLASLVIGTSDYISPNDLKRLKNSSINDDILARLSRIEQKIDLASASSAKFVTQVLSTLQKNQMEQKIALQMATEIKTWVKDLHEKGNSLAPEIQASLNEILEHSGNAYQYLQVAVPILPGILSYNTEIGTQHLLNLKNIWKQLQEKLF
jgi:hypothetical protein